MVKVQELGVKVLRWILLDVLGLEREIIDEVKEEPVERLGVRNWAIPFFLFFFLFDIIFGVIRKVAVESSYLRGELEER